MNLNRRRLLDVRESFPTLISTLLTLRRDEPIMYNGRVMFLLHHGIAHSNTLSIKWPLIINGSAAPEGILIF